jgi:hypothetical protein
VGATSFLALDFGFGSGVVALLGACCPTNGGSPTKVPLLWNNLIFFSGGAVDANDTLMSIDKTVSPLWQWT